MYLFQQNSCDNSCTKELLKTPESKVRKTICCFESILAFVGIKSNITFRFSTSIEF